MWRQASQRASETHGLIASLATQRVDQDEERSEVVVLLWLLGQVLAKEAQLIKTLFENSRSSRDTAPPGPEEDMEQLKFIRLDPTAPLIIPAMQIGRMLHPKKGRNRI